MTENKTIDTNKPEPASRVAEREAREKHGVQGVYGMRIANIGERLAGYACELGGLKLGKDGTYSKDDDGKPWKDTESKAVETAVAKLQAAAADVAEAASKLYSIPKEHGVRGATGGGFRRTFKVGDLLVFKTTDKYAAIGEMSGALKKADDGTYTQKKLKVVSEPVGGAVEVQVGSGAAAKKLILMTAMMESAPSK